MQQIGKDCVGLKFSGKTIAFTLVELLVVIAIIAILAALLLSALARGKDEAYKAKCLSNLKQLQLAHHLYADDYRGLFVTNAYYDLHNPYAFIDNRNWCSGIEDWLNGTPQGSNTNTVYLTDRFFFHYLSNVGVFKCPADRLDSDAGPRLRSYSMSCYVGTADMRDVVGATNFYRVFLKESDLIKPGPANTWVFIDEHPDSINDGYFIVPMPSKNNGRLPVGPWGDMPASYHNRSGCLSFADGHVECHKWVDKQTMPPIQKTDFANYNNLGSGTLSTNDGLWFERHTTAQTAQ